MKPNKAKIEWASPEKISDEDRQILFEETLQPGSLWQANYSDFMILTWRGGIDRPIPPATGDLGNFIRIREDVSSDVWRESLLIKNTNAVRAAFKNKLTKEQIEKIVGELGLWQLIEKNDWVLLTSVEFIRPQDEVEFTWFTPLRITFAHNQKFLTTWGMDLDTWFDLFERRETQ